MAFILIFLLMPETKQLTLEALDDIFLISATDFAKHQLTETVPYVLRRLAHPSASDTRKNLYAAEVGEGYGEEALKD